MNENFNMLISKLLEYSELKSLRLDIAKQLFFNYLKTKNNCDTIKYYENIFYRIDKFLSKHSITETKEINDNLLLQLITECQNENLSSNYINKQVKTLKYMIKVLSELGYINSVEFKIKKLSEVENRIDSIDTDTLLKILEFIKTRSIRTRLIVLLLLATGVRRKELVNIKLENIDLASNSIILETTKTKVLRTCFITEELNILINEYINQYKPAYYLFEKGPYVSLDPRSITKVLDKIKVCLNLEKLSAHQFRHTFGTCIYDSSLDIELTRVLLGHSSYNMTRRYIHNSKQKLKDKYNECNPLVKYHV